MNDLKNSVIKCIFEVLYELKNADTTKIDTCFTVNTSLYKDCKINSIQIIVLIMKIEEKFGFNFLDNELKMERFETVDSIADAVINHIQSDDKK